MREHTYLTAMVSFVGKHVAQHFRPNRPRLSPAVSAKFFNAAPATAERFRQHLFTARRALGQSGKSLPRRAVCAAKLFWNLQVRRRKPDPLGADIVHVRENRRNVADLAGRFGTPGRGVKTLDKHVVRAIIYCKNLGCGSAQVQLNML